MKGNTGDKKKNDTAPPTSSLLGNMTHPLPQPLDEASSNNNSGTTGGGSGGGASSGDRRFNPHRTPGGQSLSSRSQWGDGGGDRNKNPNIANNGKQLVSIELLNLPSDLGRPPLPPPQSTTSQTVPHNNITTMTAPTTAPLRTIQSPQQRRVAMTKKLLFPSFANFAKHTIQSSIWKRRRIVHHRHRRQPLI